MLAPAGLAVSILLYTVFNWSPFDFTLSKTLFVARWPAFVQVPFRSYYDHSEVRAAADFALKFAMSMPVGLFAALVGDRGRREFKRLSFLSSCILAGALFFTIEVGQILLPSRFPDVTDVLIGVLGFAGGMAVVPVFRDWRHSHSALARTR
jgi:glycopeptide antibiotics resistance protein